VNVTIPRPSIQEALFSFKAQISSLQEWLLVLSIKLALFTNIISILKHERTVYSTKTKKAAAMTSALRQPAVDRPLHL
jgi:hypothetical protein